MTKSSVRKGIGQGFIVCSIGVLLAVNPWANVRGAASVTPVVINLDSPRGLAIGPAGRLMFAEIDGSFSELITRGRQAGTRNVLGSVAANFIAPSMAVGGLGQLFVLTAGGAPGTGAATLYKANPGVSDPKVLADIGAYQETDVDPFNIGGPPEESNPFGVALLPDGSILVSDAAANDLLRVFPDGHIVTVARLKPRVVAVPDELPDVGFPPAGTMLPSEGVATSVTVGADGYYYVGELRGFPSATGKSQVWRIAPDSVNAVCDPQAPATGACRRYADGFTSIVALAAGPDGSIYVVQLVRGGWLQWEEGIVPPIGSLFRIPPGGGTATELAAGQLILPGGVVVAEGGVYVTTPVFGPGMVARVQ